MKTTDLKELYLDELRDLYSAENQIVDALPKMADAAKTTELKDAIKAHLEQTKGQIQRLQTIFDDLGEKPTGEFCDATAGLLKEGDKVVKTMDSSSVRDAAIIGAAQRVEHYEMAAYGTTRTYAELLGFDDHASLLQATLDEETETNFSLNNLAMEQVNIAALSESRVSASAGGKQ